MILLQPLTNPYGQEPMNQGYQGFQPTPQAHTPAPPAPAPVSEPPKPIEKGPIPSEHEILQEVFDGLKDKCLAAASHPVIINVLLIVCTLACLIKVRSQ